MTYPLIVYFGVLMIFGVILYLTMFSYNPTYRVAVCYLCHTCFSSDRRGQEQHLRTVPYRLSGTVLRAILDLIAGYDLGTVAEL